jgi:hypothetical protein
VKPQYVRQSEVRMLSYWVLGAFFVLLLVYAAIACVADGFGTLASILVVAAQEPNRVYSQISPRFGSDSLRISGLSGSPSLRMGSHSGENNSQTSVSAHTL